MHPFKTYIELDEYNYNEGVYYGRIFYRNVYGNKKYFRKIDKVIVTTLKDEINVDDLLVLINTIDGEMLFLDTNKKHVLDTEDEPNLNAFGTGFEYLISIDNRED